MEVSEIVIQSAENALQNPDLSDNIGMDSETSLS